MRNRRMTNLFQILNQFVMLFRKNVIEKSFMNWRVLSWVKIKTRILDTPVYCVAKNQNTKYLLNDFNEINTIS
jgi:hypothetical protein